ncbi:unnamed protein product [Closterium sp. NIES-53]
MICTVTILHKAIASCFTFLAGNNLTGHIPASISTLTSLRILSLHSNQLDGSFPTTLLSITSLESLNSFYGPIPDCLFNAFPCLNRLDVSHNSFYGRINRNFEGIVPTAGALLNLAHNFFYGDPVLFASGCQFCPSEIAGESVVEPGDLSVQAGGNCVVLSEAGRWVGVSSGFFQCSSPAAATPRNFPSSHSPRPTASLHRRAPLVVAQQYQQGQASLANNCFQPTAPLSCPATPYSNPTTPPNSSISSSSSSFSSSSSSASLSPAFSQRTPAACRAFCSITDNGPCDGHGACVPPPQGPDSSQGSTSNFSCECDAGYSAFDSGNGSMCVILTTTTVPGPGLSPGAVAGIALGCFVGLALLAAILVWFLLPRRRRKWGDLDVCHEFSLQQLVQATDNWADANRLGRGGFATVYLGVSAQGEMWAVKRCRVMTNDFEKEVRAMATLRHENLVRLLGFCVDMQVESGRQEQVLVYEYVGNGDLKHHIHHAKCELLVGGVEQSAEPSGASMVVSRSCIHSVCAESSRQEQVLVYEYVGNGDLKHHIHHANATAICNVHITSHPPTTPPAGPLTFHRRLRIAPGAAEGPVVPAQLQGPLTFHQRLRIALGVAEGLSYLHSFSTPIVHRDVKPANILVTDSLATKQLTKRGRPIISPHSPPSFPLHSAPHTPRNPPAGPLTFHQRLRIALGAAEGLSYLHSFSTPIVHRDVKPANILVTDSLAAKLADFGLLKQLTEGDGEGGATRIAGTPGYVDPDYNRTRVVSPKTDVYSFGVVLLEMLTGRPAVMSEEDYHIATWVSALSVSLPLLHTGAVIHRLSMPSPLRAPLFQL